MYLVCFKHTKKSRRRTQRTGFIRMFFFFLSRYALNNHFPKAVPWFLKAACTPDHPTDKRKWDAEYLQSDRQKPGFPRWKRKACFTMVINLSMVLVRDAGRMLAKCWDMLFPPGHFPLDLPTPHSVAFKWIPNKKKDRHRTLYRTPIKANVLPVRMNQRSNL